MIRYVLTVGSPHNANRQSGTFNINKKATDKRELMQIEYVNKNSQEVFRWCKCSMCILCLKVCDIISMDIFVRGFHIYNKRSVDQTVHATLVPECNAGLVSLPEPWSPVCRM